MIVRARSVNNGDKYESPIACFKAIFKFASLPILKITFLLSGGFNFPEKLIN